ncbi:MAG: hypothetical protein PHU25_07780 [Deltaproteobacteria bacterium]|nr:hypothetical protein [Deltaproteobacteria bacterium]
MRRAPWVALAAVLTVPAAAGAQEQDPGAAGCGGKRCLIVESEPALGDEAERVVDTLGLRLARYGLFVMKSAPGEIRPPDAAGKEAQAADRLLWIVHLRVLSPELALVAVDNTVGRENDDLVREVRRERDPAGTAWTMALMIEEAILPYLEPADPGATLGAGLSIIEPSVVGGVKKEKEKDRSSYPVLRCVGLSLAVFRLLSTEEFVLGPRLELEGTLHSRVIAAVNASWAGWGTFDRDGIDGSVSYLPLGVTIGVLALASKWVDLAVTAGASVGFSIYRTSGFGQDRTDVLFNPQVIGKAVAVLHVYGPWAVAVDGGVAVVLDRDVLRNRGKTVYRQDRVLPFADIGIQYYFN